MFMQRGNRVIGWKFADYRRIVGRVLICLGVSGIGSYAATDTPLTWEQCVQEAVAQNANLRNARALVDAAHYQSRAAHGGFYPELSADLNYSDVSNNSSTATSSATSSYNASVGVTQNLFAGFQDQAKVAQASANQMATEAGYTGAKAQLSQDLKTAFAGLRYAQDNVVLTGQIMRRLEENVRLVELRFEGGRENKGAFLLTRATLGQARLDNLRAVQAIQSAQTQLARALGRERSAELRVEGSVPVASPQSDPMLEQRLTEVPSYRQALAQQQAADAGVDLARAPLLPSVNLSGSVARTGEDWFPEDNRRTVGINLSIPLYSGGRDYYGLRSATSSRAAAAANTASVAQQVRVQLAQAHAAYVEAVARLTVDADFLEAATTRAQIARSQYNNGLLSFNDWDRIENDLIQRQKAYLQSQRDRVSAEAAWEFAQGRGVIP